MKTQRTYYPAVLTVRRLSVPSMERGGLVFMSSRHKHKHRAVARYAARRDASPHRENAAQERRMPVLASGGFAGNGRGLRPRTPAWLCHFCCLGAEGGGEAIHDVAASAQILAGIGRALRKAAQDQQAVGGEFAGIFCRRIVARRQGEWHGLDEAGLWLGLEAAQKLLFAGRDEAAYGHEAAHGALHDAIDFGGVFFGCFAHGEAHMVEEGRGKEREIAHGIPAPGGIKHRMADVGESDEAIGMARLPQRPRGIEPDVAANGLELPRIEGKLDEAAAVPARPLRVRAPPDVCAAEKAGPVTLQTGEPGAADTPASYKTILVSLVIDIFQQYRSLRLRW